MSDDSHISSGASTADEAAGGNVPLVRLAIVSRMEQAADALWGALDHRSRSHNRPLQTRADRSAADIIVYLPVEDDFASENAAKSLEADIARDAAQKKIVFEPASLPASDAQERIGRLRDLLSTQDAIEWIPANTATDGERSVRRQGVSRNQARQIERYLKGKAPKSKPAVAPVVEETVETLRKSDKPQKERSLERAKKKEARREARGSKGELPDQKRVSELSVAKGKAPPPGKKARSAKPAGTRPRAPNRESSDPALVPQRKSRAHAGKPAPLPAVSIALSGMGEEEKAALMESLRHAFRESGAQAVEVKPSTKARISVHAFDDHPSDSVEVERLAQDLASKARVRILLDRTAFRAKAEKRELENPAIAQTSLLCRGALFDLDALLGRHGIDASSADAAQRAAGLNLTAALIAREAANIPKLSLLRRPLTAPPDLADVLRLADAPSGLLSSLSWSSPYPPKVFRAQYTQTAVESFADRKIIMSDGEVRDFSDRIDWQSCVGDARTASQLFGLEFLIAPLSYWYSKASDRKGKQLDKIDASLKQRGVTASAILTGAADIIRDFLEKMPPQVSSAAWRGELVSTRVRALTIYILCCKLAVKRRIKFDEAACGAVFRGLVDHIEFLRSELRYPLVAMEGVERDCLLAGAGLALQPTDYGSVLLRESLERLKRRQLDIGLSADGVWRNGPLGAHCAVLSALTALLGDLVAAGSNAMEPVAEAARKMTLFVDAMLKSNGEPLPMGGTRAKSYASTLSGARRALAAVGTRPSKDKPVRGMATNRITETYLFRDAQYFVSHSTPKVTPESSQVAFHAEPGSPSKGEVGGLVLAFAHGPSNLLLGQVSRRKELAGMAGLGSWDPSLRNGFRAVAAGESRKEAPPRSRAGIVKSWRGPGWAAAKGIESYSQAELARTIVHLKALHALLVVDEIAVAGSENQMWEQFWHFAPNLVPPENLEGPLQFAVPEDGFLSVAFDGQPVPSLDRDAFSSCVRRAVQVGRGVTASLFHWTSLTAEANLSLLRAEPGDWGVSISAPGASLHVSLASNDLRIEEAALQIDNSTHNT